MPHDNQVLAKRTQRKLKLQLPITFRMLLLLVFLFAFVDLSSAITLDAECPTSWIDGSLVSTNTLQMSNSFVLGWHGMSVVQQQCHFDLGGGQYLLPRERKWYPSSDLERAPIQFHTNGAQLPLRPCPGSAVVDIRNRCWKRRNMAMGIKPCTRWRFHLVLQIIWSTKWWSHWKLFISLSGT